MEQVSKNISKIKQELSNYMNIKIKSNQENKNNTDKYIN
jgi:hypothetical protein